MKEFERLLLSQLIVAQPHNYTEVLQRPVPVAPRTIRRAVEILEHHADELLTVEDVASATGISVRALQDGFKKYYGTTPMGYLREVRMKAVRTWLLDADPSTTTVSDAATRCGFLHLGRFSVQYREKFGESPRKPSADDGRPVLDRRPVFAHCASRSRLATVEFRTHHNRPVRAYKCRRQCTALDRRYRKTLCARSKHHRTPCRRLVKLTGSPWSAVLRVCRFCPRPKGADFEERCTSPASTRTEPAACPL